MALIDSISDTALWVAVYRAMESEREDALFRDPYARRLAGERGERIVAGLPYAEQAWPTIVRTAVLDELILAAVRRDGVRLVLNLAAGLDARPYRLHLPADLLWVEVDLPQLLAYKEEQLSGETPHCRLERVAADLSVPEGRKQAFDRADATGQDVLVVSEGLLVYLAQERVAGLARDLAARDRFRWWLLDLAGPMLLQWSGQNWGDDLERAGTPMVFGPAEGPAFFRPFGWKVLEDRSGWEEARRLDREPAALREHWDQMTPEQREPFSAMSRQVLLGREVA